VSILVVEPDETNGPAIVELLVAEGDEVGVIVADAAAGDRWKSLGAHVAVGEAEDPDLIERAAQHARSIVLFDAAAAVVGAVIEGARMASVSPARIVYCSTAPGEIEPILRTSGLEYVILSIPIERAGLRRRPRQALNARLVAKAVSAADDLAGNVRLIVDLQTAQGVAALGLDAVGETP
jgi:hypothetical protein